MNVCDKCRVVPLLVLFAATAALSRSVVVCQQQQEKKRISDEDSCSSSSEDAVEELLPSKVRYENRRLRDRLSFDDTCKRTNQFGASLPSKDRLVNAKVNCEDEMSQNHTTANCRLTMPDIVTVPADSHDNDDDSLSITSLKEAKEQTSQRNTSSTTIHLHGNNWNHFEPPPISHGKSKSTVGANIPSYSTLGAWNFDSNAHERHQPQPQQTTKQLIDFRNRYSFTSCGTADYYRPQPSTLPTPFSNTDNPNNCTNDHNTNTADGERTTSIGTKTANFVTNIKTRVGRSGFLFANSIEDDDTFHVGDENNSSRVALQSSTNVRPAAADHLPKRQRDSVSLKQYGRNSLPPRSRSPLAAAVTTKVSTGRQSFTNIDNRMLLLNNSVAKEGNALNDDANNGKSPDPLQSPLRATTTTLHDANTNKKNMETARANYNSKIMPSRLIMVRHGQSEGNSNESLYATKPDNAMTLTKLGWDQAKMAGLALRRSILQQQQEDNGGGGSNSSIHFIVSPYVRTVETFHGLASAWCDPNEPEFTTITNKKERIQAWYARLSQMGLSWHEDPRIREQDFGNYQDPAAIQKAKRERHEFGVFYYRFLHGESASDVFDRVSTFLDSLWRSFDLKRCKNYVLVTHGISIRVLLARYFRYSIDQFNSLANPKNCEMIVLGHDGFGRLRLDGRCELVIQRKSTEQKTTCAASEEDDIGETHDPRVQEEEEEDDVEVVGFKFYQRLRILPDRYVKQRHIRYSHEQQ